MKKWKLFQVALIGLVATYIIFQSSHVHADLVITGASDPKYKVGEKLPDNTKLEIPADITVSILKIPEQETYVVRGPHTGTLEEYIKKKTCPWIERLFGVCGREDRSEPPTGGVRAIRPKD
ncbi:MAG: hypothetical protein ACRBBN_01880 [Methyloligellaceae bacterium]